MSAGRRKLEFVLALIDRVSGPISKIQARLYALGVQQMLLFRQNFHSYGQAAAQAATKVSLITAAIVAATAATAALTSALLPLAGMAVTGIGAAVGTANAAGIAQEATQLQQKTGMSTDQMLLYRHAGRFVGMEAGMGELGDTGQVFAEIQAKLKAPDAEFAKVLQQVKIPLKEIKNLQPDQFMNKMADQMTRLGMSDQMKSKLLDSIIDDGSKLLPILGANNSAMQRFRTMANATGAVLSKEQIALMRNASMEWSLMKTGVEGYGNSLADVGGNFMKLFGPEINQWLVDNKTEFNRWTQGQIAELKRLHGVFKQGGLQAVYEDLFPNLSAFTGRVGAFVTGFTRSFADPFMASVRNTWASVSAVLGSTAGGAEGFGAAFGAALLPIFTQTIEIIGSTIIWLESNWGIVKQIFAWSPLGLIIDNWSGIVEFLRPINAWIIQLAESMGMVAPGFNHAGNAGGTLFGVLAAIAGVLLLNKLAFGAVYQIVRLYSFALAMVRMLTIPVVIATKMWTLALKVHELWTKRVLIMQKLNTAATAAWGAAMSLASWPVLLVVGAIALLAAGLIYVYNHFDQFKSYLANTAAFGLWQIAVNAMITGLSWLWSTISTVASVIKSVFIIALAGGVIAVESLIKVVSWVNDLWNSAKSSLGDTLWGQWLLNALNLLFSPFDTFKLAITSTTALWKTIKSSLGDTAWGQAIIGTIESIMGVIGKFKEGWTWLQNAASDKIDGAIGSIKATLGISAEANPTAPFGGARALGGTVLPGHFYRVNEQGPELLQTHGQTFLMTGGAAGNIIPFPAMHERNQRLVSSKTSLSNQRVDSSLVASNSTQHLASVSQIRERLNTVDRSRVSTHSDQNLAIVSQISERLNTVDRSRIAKHSNQNIANVTQLHERMSSSNQLTELSDRLTEARERSSTSQTFKREAKVLDLRQVMARANNTSNSTNRNTPAGKNISIGEVHIHTHEMDAHDFQAQLEMMG